MSVSRKELLFQLISLLLVVLIVNVVAKLYNPVLSIFPRFTELEIQFYLISFILVIGGFLIVWKLSYLNSFSQVKKFLIGEIKIPTKMFIYLTLFGFIFCWYFLEYLYQEPSFLADLNQMGVRNYEPSFLIFSAIFVGLVTIISARVFNDFLIKIKKSFYLFFAILMIVGLSFVFASFNLYDYAYFAGPINDILHGKYLLFNSSSQYGFLSIIFLSLPFYIFDLNLFNLSLLQTILVTLSYILLFFIIQLIFQSRIFSLFTIFSVILFGYLIQTGFSGAYPQTHVFRFGMWILIGLMIALELNSAKLPYQRIFKVLGLLLVGISFFWVFDNGLYTLLAYLSFIIFINLQKSLRSTFSVILEEMVLVLIAVILVFFTINISYLILGVPINWQFYLSDPNLYIHGFGMLPFPDSIWPKIFIVSYSLTFVYLFTKLRVKGGLSIEQKIMSFILFYGIFQFCYFLGRSHLNNLHHVSAPAIICAYYLLERLLVRIRNNSKTITALIPTIFVSLILTVPFYLFLPQGIINLEIYGLNNSLKTLKDSSNVNKYIADTIIEGDYWDELKDKYGQYFKEEGITLVAMNDTWYLTELEMSNNLPSNNLFYFVDDNQFAKLADPILQNKYQYIFLSAKTVDHTDVNRIYSLIFPKLENYYEFKENIGNLSVFEYKEKSQRI